jgi:DNA-binding GntR family transcriptional regulator
MAEPPAPALPQLGQIAVDTDRHSLVDIAYLALREAITSGALAAGTRLREAPLARHFAVSTTPVREALRRLDREGLVRLAPNRGAVVAEFSHREISDLFEIREILECRAIRRAAGQDVRELARAEAIMAAAGALLGHAEPPDRIEWNRLDVSFHRALNDLSGNIELAELAERIHRTVQALCVQSMRDPIYGPEKLHQMQDHHRGIVEAVRAGNPREAESRMRAHIRVVRDSVADVLGGDGAAH